MALEHAILVALSEQASTGYDLARRFDKSIGQFWTATHQQVYKVLGRMEGDGWVDAKHVAQVGRPDKKVYSLTDDGRNELRAWLSEPAQPETTRSDLAVKVRGMANGSVKDVLAEVRRHRERHAERLDAYERNEKHEFPDPSRLKGRKLHQYLVLRGGIMLERNAVDWCDEILTTLDRQRGTR